MITHLKLNLCKGLQLMFIQSNLFKQNSLFNILGLKYQKSATCKFIKIFFINLNSIYVSGLIVKQTFLFSGF